MKCCKCGADGHRANACPRPKRTQRKEATERRYFQKPPVAQVSEARERVREESVSKMWQRLFVKSWVGLYPMLTVKTLTITDGIQGMTHVAKQQCDDGTWILADTGATHEPRRFQRVLDLANSSWQSVTLRDGPVLMDWFIL